MDNTIKAMFESLNESDRKQITALMIMLLSFDRQYPYPLD